MRAKHRQPTCHVSRPNHLPDGVGARLLLPTRNTLQLRHRDTHPYQPTLCPCRSELTCSPPARQQLNKQEKRGTGCIGPHSPMHPTLPYPKSKIQNNLCALCFLCGEFLYALPKIQNNRPRSPLLPFSAISTPYPYTLPTQKPSCPSPTFLSSCTNPQSPIPNPQSLIPNP